MTIETTAMLLGGFVLLVLGAELLVRGASRLAGALGISPLVIGLTVVACGTSAPELSVSLQAALAGNADIAVANVVGSNICNILWIIGVSSLVTPGGLNVAPSLLNFDMEVMVATALACLPIFFTGCAIARWEGWLFLGG
jgi:cation:H+ antiporter